VHWHGVRLENRSDGAVGVTQAAVQPGDRYLYRVHFRDAGIYWYHPHVREDIQQDLGLAGNVLVTPAARYYWSTVNREEVLLLDDLLLTERALVPYGREAPTHALSGRHGNVTLVNGDPRWSLTVARGEVVVPPDQRGQCALFRRSAPSPSSWSAPTCDGTSASRGRRTRSLHLPSAMSSRCGSIAQVRFRC
jgi:hypothetical protein